MTRRPTLSPGTAARTFNAYTYLVPVCCVPGRACGTSVGRRQRVCVTASHGGVLPAQAAALWPPHARLLTLVRVPPSHGTHLRRLVQKHAVLGVFSHGLGAELGRRVQRRHRAAVCGCWAAQGEHAHQRGGEPPHHGGGGSSRAQKAPHEERRLCRVIATWREAAIAIHVCACVCISHVVACVQPQGGSPLVLACVRRLGRDPGHALLPQQRGGALAFADLVPDPFTCA